MNATAWEIVLTTQLVAILVGSAWIGYVLFIKHGPKPDGLTCGWSGCPFCTERSHR